MVRILASWLNTHDFACHSASCAPPPVGDGGSDIVGGPWYHGTKAALKPGDTLKPGNVVGKENWPGMDVGGSVWLTRSLADAIEYAQKARGPGVPVVYVTNPTSPPENYAELNGWEDDGKGKPPKDEWITDSARVVRTIKVRKRAK